MLFHSHNKRNAFIYVRVNARWHKKWYGKKEHFCLYCVYYCYYYDVFRNCPGGNIRLLPFFIPPPSFPYSSLTNNNTAIFFHRYTQIDVVVVVHIARSDITIISRTKLLCGKNNPTFSLAAEMSCYREKKKGRMREREGFFCVWLPSILMMGGGGGGNGKMVLFIRCGKHFLLPHISIFRRKISWRWSQNSRFLGGTAIPRLNFWPFSTLKIYPWAEKTWGRFYSFFWA